MTGLECRTCLETIPHDPGRLRTRGGRPRRSEPSITSASSPSSWVQLPLVPAHPVHGHEDPELHLRVDEGLRVRGKVSDEAAEVGSEDPGLVGMGQAAGCGGVRIYIYPGEGAVLPRLEARFWPC